MSNITLTEEELFNQFETSDFEERIVIIERAYDFGFDWAGDRMKNQLQVEMTEQNEHMEFARQ